MYGSLPTTVHRPRDPVAHPKLTVLPTGVHLLTEPILRIWVALVVFGIHADVEHLVPSPGGQGHQQPKQEPTPLLRG